MRLKYNLIQHYKKLSLIIFVVVAISITYVTKYGIKAANQNNIGDFIVTGGTYGIDYEYGDVTYYIQDMVLMKVQLLIRIFLKVVVSKILL